MKNGRLKFKDLPKILYVIPQRENHLLLFHILCSLPYMETKWISSDISLRITEKDICSLVIKAIEMKDQDVFLDLMKYKSFKTILDPEKDSNNPRLFIFSSKNRDFEFISDNRATMTLESFIMFDRKYYGIGFMLCNTNGDMFFPKGFRI